MSLREELADRMFAAVNEAPPTEGVAVRHVMYRELALALADECIRQMEWAKRTPRGIHTDVPINRTLTVEEWRERDRIIFGTLTLAPEGWQP